MKHDLQAVTNTTAPNAAAPLRQLVSAVFVEAVAVVKAAADHAAARCECDAAAVEYVDASAPVDEAVAVATLENYFEMSLCERWQQRRGQEAQTHSAHWRYEVKKDSISQRVPCRQWEKQRRSQVWQV